VNGFRNGDEVWGTIWPSSQGSFGEYAVTTDDYVIFYKNNSCPLCKSFSRMFQIR